MLGFLFKKQREIENMIRGYLRSVEIARENFVHAMKFFFDERMSSPDFEFLVGETHKAESRSDDIQEKIGGLLFEKALIPEFRADILTLLECIDNVPDQFDRILYSIQTQKIRLPEAIREDFQELLAVSMDACSLMLECVECLLKGGERTGRLCSMIDQKESHGDHIERRTITRIFESDWDPLQKILLRDLSLGLGEIADHTAQVSRQVNLIVIKRRV